MNRLLRRTACIVEWVLSCVAVVLAMNAWGILGAVVLIPVGLFGVWFVKRVDPDGAGKELESDEFFWG